MATGGDRQPTKKNGDQKGAFLTLKNLFIDDSRKLRPRLLLMLENYQKCTEKRNIDQGSKVDRMRKTGLLATYQVKAMKLSVLKSPFNSIFLSKNRKKFFSIFKFFEFFSKK